jgi:hypothetical protein
LALNLPDIPGISSREDIMASMKASAADFVSHGVEAAGGSVKQIRRLAETRFDRARFGAARSLKTAAQGVQVAGENGARKVNDVTGSISERLHSGSRYLRKNDFGSITADLKEAVRRQPGTAMVVALSVGFIMGSVCKRR